MFTQLRLKRFFIPIPRFLMQESSEFRMRNGGEVGEAFIVLKPKETMGNGEVFEFLKGKVAEYKIPKVVEYVEALPKTASGKIQKFILKETHAKHHHSSTK